MAAAESITSNDGKGQETAPVSLLLIEDVSVTAEIERSYFASVGFNVLAGGNVSEAESVIASQWVDIVIIDAAFARRKGIELIPILKKAARNRDVKVIVTSVSGDPALKRAATTAGASAFIVKPAPRPRYLKEIKKLSAQKARDTERIHRIFEVAIRWRNSNVTAEALDVSSEGIHLAITSEKDVIELGARIDMTFSIEGKDVKMQGEIVRHTPKGIGVRFVGVGAQAQRVLDKFLLRHSIEHQASQFYL
ncbi:MAG: response regulator [Silvanigrellaceae bacterium]